ncbi:uveal autoantigen with coiled-coil domains and ankyrin repeats [Copidosoma floridanum]|uniref:uveal autoantigen with coiled-coil domains and ankyrin repeats n=1 Tax=Copidosoma floridanum TaxID=29053 RepID=UPI0006C96B05|nr:uveal autoantigen with coiled-coil domains and ankyrin repeats [Copidosoma floridanum]
MDDIGNESDAYSEYGSGEEAESSSGGSIPEPITYNTEDFVSQPRLSEHGTVPQNILEFDHSFGYDCRKRFNLCAADPDTLIFASGNLIHFLDVPENKLTFRRSSTGGGIGHITKNPAFNHIAIGENGIDPPVIIYEWPGMEIVSVLLGGTTRSYSHLRYSPDGEQLVTQGGEPDYLITIWNWRSSKVALQCKSHGQDVYNVVFSPTMPGHMTSCGSGHIKTWKMSGTFTGLKLQGELGRFGKTEISDIVGVYPMPDEKVISGCEWGNILVWDEGLIKIEVRRKQNRPCHAGYVSQFEYISDELVSIGTDGRINFWYYETIDLAEQSEDNHYLEVEPIYEVVVEEGEDTAMLMQILKREPADPDDALWYAQDGNGGLWLVDLSTMRTPEAPKKLLRCHAGPIMDMDAADWGPYAATIGQDGRLHVYDYLEKRLLLAHRFLDPGSCLLWLPCSVEPSGSTLVCAFGTGVLRVVIVDPTKATTPRLIQVLKPHVKSVTRVSTNPSNTVLVTGSEDMTVFVFRIERQEKSYPVLVPIGYLRLPSGVTFVTWKPQTKSTVLVGCSRGDCVQADLPEEVQAYTTISYELTECEPIAFKFESVKSSILREQARLANERRRQERIAELMAELASMREKDPNLELDEDVFFESELEDEPPLPEIYVPEVPNGVLAAFYTTRDTLLLSIAGYDAGYTYEYSNPQLDQQPALVGSNLVVDSDDQEIRSFLFLSERKYIVLGMERGEIRVCRTNPREEADFSDYWLLPMHDNDNGHVSSMRLGCEGNVLLTCGYDGSIFSFAVNDDSGRRTARVRSTADVPDIEDLDHPSLEEVIVQAERDRVMRNAKEDKEHTLAVLRELTEEFNSILKRNGSLPQSQRLTDDELELDQRITVDLDRELEAQMELVHDKLAHDLEKSKLRLKKLMDHFVEPITCLSFVVKKISDPSSMVHSLRELKLTGDYAVGQSDSSRNDEHHQDGAAPANDQQSLLTLDSARTASTLGSGGSDREAGAPVPGMESFLKGLSPETIQFHLGDEINQLLKKYRSLKGKLEEQEQEWKTLQSEKPDPKAVNSEDKEAIERSKSTVGDYKLKVLLDVDPENRATVESKYKQIVDCRRKIHFRREDFNTKLRELRARKVELQVEVDLLLKRLKKIHDEIPEEQAKALPKPPAIDHDEEFPEKNLELESYVPTSERIKKSKKRRLSSITTQMTVDDSDEEYEILLMDEARFRPNECCGGPGDGGGNSVFALDEKQQVQVIPCVVPLELIAALQLPDKSDSKLEREMKRARMARKIHEQDEILSHISRSYEAFDEELGRLEGERLDIVYESVYMDLHLLTMHQELIVLKKFEGMEKEFSRKVDDQVKTRTLVAKKIEKLARKVEEKKNSVARLREKIKENTARYLNSIAGHKYYVFLKKICKKKYSAPKPHDDHDDDASSFSFENNSSSSSSSSSSSEDDPNDPRYSSSSDFDSERVALLHMTETECPDDLEREIYDEAFAVRETRYAEEHRIQDEWRSAELLQEELDAQRNRIETTEIELKADRAQLQALLREKQKQLNDIDVTVIMKLDQLQLFTGEADKPESIQNCIVFDKDRLSRLYARVGELEQDTRELQEKHRNDKGHLRKIKVDCESMRKELEALKEQTQREMEQKFGQQVSLVSLYEAVLKRLIHNIKANTSSLMKFYDDKIKVIRKEYKEQLQVLKDLIQDNTEKLSFLTVLEEELFKLHKMQKLKIIPEEEISKIESQYKSDLSKLKAMLKNQEKQKESISRDIRSLSLKTKCLQPEVTERKKPDKPTGSGPKSAGKVDESKPASFEDKEITVDDCEHFKKVIAIRHLLSQITAVDDVNTKETVEKMLREVIGKLKRAGCCEEEIKKNISEIMHMSDEEQESSQIDNLFSSESLADIIHQYDEKTNDISFAEEINPETYGRLRELFSSVGIKDETGSIALTIVKNLKTSGEVASALKYTLRKLPNTSYEVKTTLREHIKHSLMEIMNNITLQLFTIKSSSNVILNITVSIYTYSKRIYLVFTLIYFTSPYK